MAHENSTEPSICQTHTDVDADWVLRSHGVCPQLLHLMAKTITVASLMYTSPAWRGFSSALDRALIEQLINKLKCSGFLPPSAPAALALASNAV